MRCDNLDGGEGVQTGEKMQILNWFEKESISTEHTKKVKVPNQLLNF